MFIHMKELQFRAKPEKPDPVYARKLQEVLGGQYGEMSVMMQYLFQGFNCRADRKYRDMLLDIGTEEIGHVEMLSTMIAQLLDGAPADQVDEAAKDPLIAAALGGMNPQHAIVSGLGATPTDSNGYPWNSKYIIASGNLLADFRANLNAESQGLLQVVRLYEQTTDPGVRDMLSFMIARDIMHQNQWLAAIEEIEAIEGPIAPASFPRERAVEEATRQFMNFSVGEESSAGRWANGPLPDGTGHFEYVANPTAYGDAPVLNPAAKHQHSTLGTGPYVVNEGTQK
ncbi:manganese catalase family protein [Virgibacillus sp. LDC1]|uniref:manganese catalase family protein n=1 Tax=Paenibacillus TaxID=44249 RepID=UPI000C270C2B|nr:MULTISPECIES: manganese catalase family protein [Paenibacillus]MCV4234628.1 manganese catalase family protein [Virgibacillus sp. LDC1]MEC0260041.1 manganese catalase family protein [Paenibacillus lautus]MEC0305563.1 manganese catalase family protein [Paenibacillus lautus]PJN50323.1 putative manganese catalase [Paenibacillus sp. GM2FR]